MNFKKKVRAIVSNMEFLTPKEIDISDFLHKTKSQLKPKMGVECRKIGVVSKLRHHIIRHFGRQATT